MKTWTNVVVAMMEDEDLTPTDSQQLSDTFANLASAELSLNCSNGDSNSAALIAWRVNGRPKPDWLKNR